MIIFGTRERLLKQQPTDLTCMNCFRDQKLNGYFYAKYFHIFWIPMFPYRKKIVAQCPYCNQVLPKEEVPEDLRYRLAAEKPRTPTGYYTGLILVLMLIVAIGFGTYNNNAKNKDLLQSPQVGDIYEIKEDDNMFTTMKIKELTGDSIGVQLNNYTVDIRRNVHELISEHANDFQEEVIYYHKDFLKHMFKSRYIIDIHRK